MNQGENSVKKFNLLLVAACISLLSVTGVLVISGAAENGEAVAASEGSIPENTLITYGYLEQFKEELKQEILDELMQSGGISVESDYKDISLKQGQTLILSTETEVIYRGGGAIAVTSSGEELQGVSDMSTGKELFSGMPLEYGHIYFASASDSKKAILVIGENAYFTVRGDYDIG